MAVLSPPGYLQGGTYSALLDRMYNTTVTGLRDFGQNHRAREGFYPSRTPTYTNPSGMQITVSPCAGVVANDFASDAGDYMVANPSSTTVTLAGSSPTLNRIDIVGFQVKDNFYDSSGLNQVTVAILQGTGSAGTPTAPTIPAGFLPVVQCLVNANATTPTSLTSLVVRTTLDGAPLFVGNATERNALGTPHQGFLVYRLDRNWLEKYDGSAWRIQGLAICTSTSDRDTAVTNPQNGDLAFTTDTNTLWVRQGGAWVEKASRRMIAQHKRTTPSSTSGGSAVAVMRISGIPMKSGRNYCVVVSGVCLDSTVTADALQVDIRFTTNNTNAGTGSTVLDGSVVFGRIVTLNSGESKPMECEYTPGADQTVSLCLCVTRIGGSGNSRLFAGGGVTIQMKVYEEELAVTDTGTDL